MKTITVGLLISSLICGCASKLPIHEICVLSQERAYCRLTSGGDTYERKLNELDHYVARPAEDEKMLLKYLKVKP